MTISPVFTEKSPLDFGLVDYSKIKTSDWAPAFDAGFEAHKAEVQAIAENQDAPTFENTMVALEKAGRLLTKVAYLFWNLTSADTNDDIHKLEEEYMPKVSAHFDSITFNSALFSRIDAIYNQLNSLDLDAESRYLVERYWDEFVRNGAKLSEEDKKRVGEINIRLSELATKFEKLLLDDTNELAVVVDSADDLIGLSETDISSAAQAAADRGLEGKYLIVLPLYTGHAYLANLENRDVRRRVLEASLARGRRNNSNDTRECLLEQVKLRAEKAKIFGYPFYAELVASAQTAGSAENIAKLTERIAAAVAPNVRREAEALAEIAAELGEASPIEAADWEYYTDKLSTKKYSVDFGRLREYCEADRVLQDGVFATATKLYGLQFKERPDLPGYHPDVVVYEVSNEKGEAVGLFLYDLYTRDSKRGGAWMNDLQSQSKLLNQLPIVCNNHNVPKPAAGQPTLLSWDEVTTLFHEFGHALHSLLSNVNYPKFSGTEVYRDYVEFPSQVNEMWATWSGVIEQYAKHYQTGEALDQDTIENLRAAATFNQGYTTATYIASALLDQAWHKIGADEAMPDPKKFEDDYLESINLKLDLVPPRYSSSYFQHIFGSGYDANYYSYIWSEVLDADAVEWFKENGGLTRENGDYFAKHLIAIGGSKDPREAYRQFRGRDPEVEPLLRRRGLIT